MKYLLAILFKIINSCFRGILSFSFTKERIVLIIVSFVYFDCNLGTHLVEQYLFLPEKAFLQIELAHFLILRLLMFVILAEHE
jgi:hypothetical protein